LEGPANLRVARLFSLELGCPHGGDCIHEAEVSRQKSHAEDVFGHDVQNAHQQLVSRVADDSEIQKKCQDRKTTPEVINHHLMAEIIIRRHQPHLQYNVGTTRDEVVRCSLQKRAAMSIRIRKSVTKSFVKERERGGLSVTAPELNAATGIPAPMRHPSDSPASQQGFSVVHNYKPAYISVIFQFFS